MNHLAQLQACLSHEASGAGHSSPSVPTQARRAAVLILLTRGELPRVTLTQRASGLRDHPGQVSFPGGGVEPGDASPTATALRESWEEVGLVGSEVEVIGALREAWVPVSGFLVTPVVAVWDGRDLLPTDPREVESVHSLSMAELAAPANRFTFRHASGHKGPAFQVDGLFVWGFTAHLLSWVLDLGGWSQPWDAKRLIDVPASHAGEEEVEGV